MHHYLRVNHWLKKYWIFSDFGFCLLSKQKTSSCLKHWSLYTLFELLNNADLVDKATNDWQRLFWAVKYVKLSEVKCKWKSEIAEVKWNSYEDKLSTQINLTWANASLALTAVYHLQFHLMISWFTIPAKILNVERERNNGFAEL